MFGILAAGLSSLFPNYLLGPWLISDFLGIKRDMSRMAFRVLVVATASFGLIVPIFGGSPVQIMIASQALSDAIFCLANGSGSHAELLGNFNGGIPFHHDQPEAFPGTLVKAVAGSIKCQLHGWIADSR